MSGRGAPGPSLTQSPDERPGAGLGVTRGSAAPRPPPASPIAPGIRYGDFHADPARCCGRGASAADRRCHPAWSMLPPIPPVCLDRPRGVGRLITSVTTPYIGPEPRLGSPGTSWLRDRASRGDGGFAPARFRATPGRQGGAGWTSHAAASQASDRRAGPAATTAQHSCQIRQLATPVPGDGRSTECRALPPHGPVTAAACPCRSGGGIRRVNTAITAVIKDSMSCAARPALVWVPALRLIAPPTVGQLT